MPSLTAAWRQALDLLFPPRCVVCGRRGDFLCSACIAAMTPADPPPNLEPWQAAARSFGRIRAVYDYAGPARQAVLALKFRGLTAAAEPMAKLMALLAVEESMRADMVLPVPLHARRERSRGYNQARLLAAPVAEALATPLRPDLLRRRRATTPQALIRDAARRRENVARAFAVTDPSQVRGAHVLLLDDVATTGATLLACAEALRLAGASSANALVFARER